MPYLNLMLFPTLALAYLAFWTGDRLMKQIDMPALRTVVAILATPFAAFAVLMAAYYLHWFDAAPWFYAFRTAPYSELSAAGAGLPAGMLSALAPKTYSIFRITRFGMMSLLGILLFIPYVKILLVPVRASDFHNTWNAGVCMQSTLSSCGPASAATLLHAQGCDMLERELARESFTSGSGTEIWYLARALQRRGFTVRYLFTPTPPDHLPSPAIAGTSFGNNPRAGHFIAILGETSDRYLIGDPLLGKLKIKKVDFSPYQFTGFFMVVQR